MCTDCGCSAGQAATLTKPGDVGGGGGVGADLTDPSTPVSAPAPARPPRQARERGPAAGHLHPDPCDGPSHTHTRPHSQPGGETVRLEQAILAKNDLRAARNRDWFRQRNILALNLVSAPGSGKTALLERTIRDLGGTPPVSVIEGDQATVNDAARIRATGCEVVQINTDTGCHLDADMLAAGLRRLAPPRDSIVMIENVGNLVCPALFDLGEACKVVVLSVTEGEDKPLKYPHMFRAAEVLLVNKIDLLPYLRFDLEQCLAHARAVNPSLCVFTLSATGGEGMQPWYRWLRERVGERVGEPVGRRIG